MDFGSNDTLHNESAREIVHWIVSTFDSHPHHAAWGLTWADAIRSAVLQERHNEATLREAARDLGFDLVPLELDESTLKRARPAEPSTVGRKRTCSGSLLPSFNTPLVMDTAVLEAPVDHLSQEVQGGVAVFVPATPYSSSKPALGRVETGLAPIQALALVAVVRPNDGL